MSNKLLKIGAVGDDGNAKPIKTNNAGELKIARNKEVTRLLNERYSFNYDSIEGDYLTALNTIGVKTRIDKLRVTFSEDISSLFIAFRFMEEGVIKTYQLQNPLAQEGQRLDRIYPSNVDNMYGDSLFEVVVNNEDAHIIEMKTPITFNEGFIINLANTSNIDKEISVNMVYTEVK